MCTCVFVVSLILTDISLLSTSSSNLPHQLSFITSIHVFWTIVSCYFVSTSQPNFYQNRKWKNHAHKCHLCQMNVNFILIYFIRWANVLCFFCNVSRCSPLFYRLTIYYMKSSCFNHPFVSVLVERNKKVSRISSSLFPSHNPSS